MRRVGAVTGFVFVLMVVLTAWNVKDGNAFWSAISGAASGIWLQIAWLEWLGSWVEEET